MEKLGFNSTLSRIYNAEYTTLDFSAPHLRVLLIKTSHKGHIYYILSLSSNGVLILNLFCCASIHKPLRMQVTCMWEKCNRSTLSIPNPLVSSLPAAETNEAWLPVGLPCVYMV